MAYSHNLAVLRLLGEYPGKFMATALVALQDVEGAIRELEWAHENGFKTAVLDYVYPVAEHPFGEPRGRRFEFCRDNYTKFGRCPHGKANSDLGFRR